MSMAYTYDSGTTTAWNSWNYTSTNSYDCTTDGTWATWTASTTTTYSTSGNYVWYSWNNGNYQKVDNPSFDWNQAAVKTKTPAEIQAERETAQRIADEAAKKYREEEKKRKEAIKKAQQLLISLLDEQQAKDLEKKGSFGFIADSGAMFIIEKGRAGNVKMIKDKKETRLCCHPRKNVPDYDTMTAQLLMIKFAEEEFVRMANKTPLN